MLAELLRAFSGCWRLAMRDPGGYDEFDLSLAGFWRSFLAIVLVAPLYLFAVDLQAAMPAPAGTQLEDQPDHSLAAAAVSLVVQWFAWPAIMAVVARYVGLTAGYTRYVIAYNWSSVLIMALQIIPIYILVQGGGSARAGTLFYMITLALVIYYRWYVTRTAFQTSAVVASAVVLADLVVSIAIARFIE